jgi:hypothetical protein
MGCCENREHIAKSSCYKPSPPKVIPKQTSPDTSEAEVNDGLKVKQILLYTDKALADDIWSTTMHSDSFITVKSARGSPFNVQMPVAYVFINFAKCIPCEDVLDVLAQPEQRRAWDKDLAEMYRFSEISPNEFLVYSVIDFKLFFLNKRELIERHYLEVEGTTAKMVYFSVEHPDFPRRPGYLRQELPFASIRIQETEKGTCLHFLVQFHNKKLESQIVWRVAINRLVSWAKHLKRTCDRD